MKNFKKIFAILLCLCLFFQAQVYAGEIKIKIGGSKQNTESKEIENKETEELENKESETKKLENEKPEKNNSENAGKQLVENNNSTKNTAKESESNSDFLLTCDYKVEVATNARVLYEDQYSFIYLDKGTYLRYSKHTDDMLEAEVFLDGVIKTVWVPTHNVVLAATIIKNSDGQTEIVNEKDPDKDSKLKNGKILLKEGDNPLINKQRIKNVNTLLYDANNYNYSGLSMEKNSSDERTSKGVKTIGHKTGNKVVKLSIGKKSKASEANDDSDENVEEEINENSQSQSNKKSNSSGTITLPVLSSKDNSNEDNDKADDNSTSLSVENTKTLNIEKSNKSSIKATVNASTALYSSNIVDSDKLSEINEGEEVDVYELGYAFSKVSYDGNDGFVPTYSLKFENGDDFVVITNKQGKANVYKDEELNEKSSSIKIGTVVHVLEEKGKVLMIDYNGDNYYIKFSDAQYISLPRSLDRIGTIISKNTNAKINARIKDKNGSAIVDKIDVGSKITIISTDEKWVHLSTPSGKYAYIQSNFVKEN